MLKPSSRSLLIAAALATVLAVGNSSALAVNPLVFDFFVSTMGEDVDDFSTDLLDAGFPQYDYAYAIDTFVVQIAGVLNVDAFAAGLLDPADYMDSGSIAGPFPLDIYFLNFDDPDTGNMLDLQLDVTASGQGHFGLSNITLGDVDLGGGPQPITRLDLGGTLTVLGVPEPASVVLAGLTCSLALLLARRRRR